MYVVSKPILHHKEMDAKEVDGKDRCDLAGGPPHNFDCWLLSSDLNFICGKNTGAVSNDVLLHGLDTIAENDEKVYFIS